MKRNTKKQNAPIAPPVKQGLDYGFVNLNTYTSPEVIEVANKDWVAYGEDNNYFQFLIDRYNGSPTNNAAINGISQAIYGKGLSATDGNKKPDQYAQMISLLHKDCVRKVCYDFKLMGQAAIQVVYSKDRKKIAQLEHFPIETLRAEKANDEGNIPAYYYFKDWIKIKPSDKPLRIPAFGMSKEKIEIYYVKPYRAGFYYYSPVDYQGGLQYAELEEEISNYHLNNIMNGLSPSMLINFNNGTPNQQERELIEQRIASKFSGSSNAGKFILAFNDNKESQAEITPVQLSDAHNQYQFLSDESAKKIMVAHRIVSPMLLGIKDNSGLGNNAEEIKTASLLMDNTVIRPFQELLIDCFDQLLAYNDISLNLYFITLQPLEFTEVDSTLQDEEEIEEETGYKMRKQVDGRVAYETVKEAESMAEQMGCKGHHKHEIEGVMYYMPCESHEELKSPCWDGYEQIGFKNKNGKKVPNCVPLESDERKLSVELGDQILDSLEGETISNEWEIVDEREAETEELSIDDWANMCINPKEGLFQKLKNEIYAKPNGFSILDKSFYKVRYKYFKKSMAKQESKSRSFCYDMMKLSKKGIVYRLEDIDRASRDGVNDQLGHNGKSYDLFKFKGGIYCRHAWKEVLYRLKKNTKESEYLKDYKKTRTIPKSYMPKPFGNKQAKIAPYDMPNKGAYPK